jgi:hypothetical protein
MADEIISEEELAALAATEEQVEAPVAEETSEQPRDPETGKFVKKEADEEGEEKPDNKVPQGALHAERERRKSAETELKKVQEQLAQLGELRRQVQSRQPAPFEKPADDTGLDHLTQRLAEQERNLNRVSQTIDLQQIEAAEQRQIQAVVAQAEAAYRSIKPDYDDAIRHVVQARARELALYGLSPGEINNALGNEVAEIVKSAISQGKDPAELGYAIAIERGYRPTGAETGGGQAQRTIDAVATAKQQSRSLGQAAGSTPQQLNADAIIAMPPDEFEALYMTPEGRKLIDSICANEQ